MSTWIVLFRIKWILAPLKLLIIFLLGGMISAHAEFLPTFTGTPSIDGTALVGNTLTIIDTGTIDDDGDPVTLSYQWLANDAPIIGATTANYLLTINEAHANITAQITADDNNDGPVTVTTAAITVANSAPTISGTPATNVSEDSGYSFTPTAGDIDGDTLTFSINIQPGWANFDSATGTISGTPVNSDVGITNGIVITVTDISLDSASLPPFNLQVINTNDPPIISSTEVTAATEDIAYSYTLIANDVDVGDVLTYSAPMLPTWLSFNPATGVLTGTPLNTDVGSHPVTLRVNDGTVDVDQSFTITVANANDAPTITSTAITSAMEDIAYTYTFEASDIDVGDLLTYSAPVLPNWLSFNPTTGALIGTPLNTDVGSHPVTLRVNDGTVDVDQSFSISVTNINDAPTISGIPATSIDEDSSYSFTPTAGDVDVGDTLTFSIANQPSWATFNSATGTLSGTPTNNDVGITNGILITVIDSSLASASLPSFSLEVINTNDAPIITTTETTFATEDVTYIYTFSATDVDVGDILTYSAPLLPSWLSFNPATGVLSGTPVNADVGNHPVTLRVNDGTADADQSFTITVANVNNAPTISGTPITSVAEDSSYSFTPTASDVDVGDSLSFSISNPPTWADFDPTTGTLSGTPTNSAVGTTSGIVITVADSSSASASLPPFNLQVINTNDPPIITSTAVTVAAEDEIYAYTFIATDEDIGDTLTFNSVSVLPAWLSFNVTTGVLTGTPGNADIGSYPVTLRVNDGTVDVDQNFTIAVTNANDAPTISSTAATSATEDIIYTYTFTASDIDVGDVLTYSAPVLPTWLSFNPATGALSGVPVNADVGSHPVTLRVNDGTVDVDQSFSIIVTNVNDAPTISGIPGTLVAEGATYSFTPTANDVDVDDSLTFSINTVPSWASFNTITGALTGTPDNNDVGTTNGIIITVTDNSSASASLPAFNLQVSNTNNAPTITGTPATSIDEDSSYSFTPTANDEDVNDTLVFSIINQPNWATFDPSNGSLSGTPTNSDVGITNNIVITVTDGSSASASLAAFNLQVFNTNDAPTITSTAITNAAQNIVYNYTFTVTDVDVGDVLTLSAPTLPAWLSFNATTGVLTGTPINADVGSHSVTLRVNDGTVDVDQSFTIAVTDANDAPTITSTAITTATEDVAYTYTFTATDIDTGEALTYSAPVLPAWLSFNTTTGVLTGTPLNADVGSHPVTLRVNDGTVDVDQSFVITVTNVNDAPTITSTAVTTAAQNIIYNYTFIATDMDVGNVLTLSAPVLPTWLSFNTATGVLNGTPLNEDVGNHSVTLRVSDGTVNVDQSFTITVGNTNDAPVITGTPITRAVEGLLYTFLPSAVDADIGDNLTFVISNMPTWSTFDTITGTLSGTPTASNVGTTSGIVIGVSDGTVTVNLPAFNITVVGDLDSDSIGDDVDTDIDGDGMPNTFETDNGLDPRNAADAALDADGDGVSNLDEFRRGTNPGQDEVAPLVIAPADITVNATGLYTQVNFGQATAVDARDGVLPVSRNLDNHLSAGTHLVTWSATDTAGNTGTAIQTINVIPLVVFSTDQLVIEGTTVNVKIILNGPAVNYPVVVPYTVSGTATIGMDHNLNNGNITLNSGTETQLTFNILNDGPGDANENIVITMGTPTNAVRGSPQVHTIKIAEGNIAPYAILSADQGQGTTRIISQENGMVTVTANVTDPNSTDIHSYDWSGSENALVDTDGVPETLSFDPTTIVPGLYTLRLIVSDGIENDEAELRLSVVSSIPVLTTADSDGDDVDDATEGYGDSDNDGVPNYLDAIDVMNILQGQSSSSDQNLMETESGLSMALGLVAFQANPGQAIITSADIVNYSNSPEDDLPNVGGIFDFVITGLSEAGESSRVVLPLLAPIPVDASFRKLMPTGWQDFVEDNRNAIFSAPGESAYCPPPGDITYTPGLTEGHWCVQLLIEDGGPNDADLRANKRIADPGGLVQLHNITVSVNSSGGAIYSSLLLLMLWRLWFLIRKRRL